MHKFWSLTSKIFPEKKHLIIGTCLLGLILRLIAGAWGHNYDFESYQLVGEIVHDGGNVYAETSRYNYGPVWMLTIGILNIFNSPELFRVLVVLFLSFIDVAIAYILYRQYSVSAAILFIINPISILITGFHSQFDNYAILIGLIGMVIISHSSAKYPRRKKVAGLVMLGISLSIKHILFIFPVWLAIREKSYKQKLLVFTIPVGIFFLSLLPFALSGGLEGISDNIFRYNGYQNAPFLNFLFGGWAKDQYLSAFYVWIGLLLTAGFVTRKLDLFKAFGLYLLILVIFSPSLINHHLAIAVLPISMFINVFFLIATVLSTYLIVLNNFDIGLAIPQFVNSAPAIFLKQQAGNTIFNLPVLFLLIGLLVNTYNAVKLKYKANIQKK